MKISKKKKRNNKKMVMIKFRNSVRKIINIKKPEAMDNKTKRHIRMETIFTRNIYLKKYPIVISRRKRKN